MSEIKDGGPAFLGPDQMETQVDIHEGMTLRDYFAAKAMQAMVTNNWPLGMETADSAYTMADCMLRARGQQ